MHLSNPLGLLTRISQPVLVEMMYRIVDEDDGLVQRGIPLERIV